MALSRDRKMHIVMLYHDSVTEVTQARGSWHYNAIRHPGLQNKVGLGGYLPKWSRDGIDLPFLVYIHYKSYL